MSSLSDGTHPLLDIGKAKVCKTRSELESVTFKAKPFGDLYAGVFNYS